MELDEKIYQIFRAINKINTVGFLPPETPVYECTLNDEGSIIWNLDRARQAVRAGNYSEVYTIDPATLAIIAMTTGDDLIERNIDTCWDINIPGISVPLRQQQHVSYYLIDGIAEARDAHLTGRPFRTYFLNPDSARDIVVWTDCPHRIV